MKITDLKEALESLAGKASFVSCTYTDKKRNETARYTLLLNAEYRKVCRADILELQLRLEKLKETLAKIPAGIEKQIVKLAMGVEVAVTKDLIASLEESIAAKNEGREHVNYTKRGLYAHICHGLKININDGTCEIQGLQQKRVVLVKGDDLPPVKHRTPETAFRAALRRELKVGKFKTLCVDAGHIHSVRLNGQELDFEQ